MAADGRSRSPRRPGGCPARSRRTGRRSSCSAPARCPRPAPFSTHPFPRRTKEAPMTRWLVAIVVALLTLTGPATAADLDGTLKKIKSTNTITIGYRESSRPFSFVGDDGKPAGYSVDLCTRIASSIGRDLNLPNLAIKWVKVTVENRIE